MPEVVHAEHLNRPIPIQKTNMYYRRAEQQLSYSESSVIVTIMRFVYNAPLSVCRRTYIVRLRIVSLKVTSSWWPDAELFISQNNPPAARDRLDERGGNHDSRPMTWPCVPSYRYCVRQPTRTTRFVDYTLLCWHFEWSYSKDINWSYKCRIFAVWWFSSIQLFIVMWNSFTYMLDNDSYRMQPNSRNLGIT